MACESGHVRMAGGGSVTPHKQTILHNPENGQYGDCFRAALASILDLGRPEDVPHFMGDPDEPMEQVWDRVNDWLAQFGLIRATIPLQANDVDAALGFMERHNPGVPYMISGTSPRGTQHETVALDSRIIHDPHPDGGGLVGPCPEGFFWISLLVRRTEAA